MEWVDSQLTGAFPASSVLWAGGAPQLNNRSLPGSPALCAGSFTFELLSTGDACLSPGQVAKQVNLGLLSTIVTSSGFHDLGFRRDLERDVFYFEKRFKWTLKDLLNAFFFEVPVLLQVLWTCRLVSNLFEKDNVLGV